MEIHLDPVGGLAGDMFIAGLLHAFPELEAGMQTAIVAVEPGLAGACRLQPHNDGVLQGARFQVGGAVPHVPPHAADHGHHHHHGDHGHSHHGEDHEPAHGHPHDHGHTPWATIRERLQRAALAPEVRTHAIGIFTVLAQAEAQVHGISVDEVAFHEVGAMDSIADIVGAASLIAALGTEGWTVAALPLGSGQVRTAHGFLPVPAPATALLLEGFLTWDDGVPGERVTPTGAAILRYLRCQSAATRPARVLGRSGVGFGTKALPGRSNCLRVLAFEAAENESRPAAVAVIEFEIDDQSPEDLAIGLDRLRESPTVLDVIQTPAFGKKGRMVTSIRVLARPEASDAVIAACFRETSTIGLRHQTVLRVALERRAEEVEIAGQTFRVKTVARPGAGRTVKLEADDLGTVPGGQRERVKLREAAEREVLSRSARANG